MSTAPQAPSVRALFYDAAYTLAGRLLRTVLALGLAVLTARLLGPYQRGLYALPTAVYTGMIVSVFTGISLSVSYFMLTAGAGRHILRPAVITAIIFSIAGSVPVLAAAELGHNHWAIAPSLAILPPSAAGMVLIGYAIGAKRIRWQTTYSVASAAALLIGVGASLAVFAHTAAVAVVAYVVANAAVAAAGLWIVFRDARNIPGKPVGLRRFIAYALRVGFVNLVTLLNYRADLYVVAFLTSTAILGQYAVAISAAEGLLVVTQVAAVVTSPHVGSMQQQDAAEMTASCVRTTLLMTLPICVVFYAIAPFLVQFLYGAAYLPLVPALRILLVAVLILSIGSPISNFFTLNRGKPEVALVSAMIAAAICLSLSWFLVPRMSMVGAAIATAVAYFLGEGVRLLFFASATNTRIRAILVPTRADFGTFRSAAAAVLRDAARLFDRLKVAVR